MRADASTRTRIRPVFRTVSAASGPHFISSAGRGTVGTSLSVVFIRRARSVRPIRRAGGATMGLIRGWGSVFRGGMLVSKVASKNVIVLLIIGVVLTRASVIRASVVCFLIVRATVSWNSFIRATII